MLELRNIESAYGSIKAVRDISLSIRSGQLVALLGANGAGKTTTINTISGFIRPQRGDIFFEGKSIRGLRPDQISARGLIQVPEGREVLASMSVEENLRLGAFRLTGGVEGDLRGIYERFPRLEERKKQLAGNLSGGEQQMLAIGRALMGRPKLLMLDEPSMGLAPIIVREVFDIIKEIRRLGVTILLVEQNVRKAFEVADYIYVINRGSILSHGEKDAVERDTHITRAYLGEGYESVEL